MALNTKLYLQQTTSLIYKNILLFSRRPITLLIRVFIIPLAIALILSYLKAVGNIGSEDSGIASSSSPIGHLSTALQSASNQRLIFVRNGFGTQVDSLVASMAGLDSNQVTIIDTPDELNTTCKQTLQASSNCFAAVVFSAWNTTTVSYIIAFDGAYLGSSNDWRHHHTPVENRVFPLQWELEKTIAGLNETSRPNEVAFSGYFYDWEAAFAAEYENSTDSSVSSQNGNANPYYGEIALLIAPFFYLIFIDLVIHMCNFIVRERENGTTELLAVHGARHLPQILSNFVTFWLLYLPTLIFTGAILSAALFNLTSAALIILLQVLAGTAIIVSCLFLSSLFSRAAFAGPVSAVVSFVFAALTFDYILRSMPQQGWPPAMLSGITGLSAIFPPFTYATLIADIARTQAITNKAFSLTSSGTVRTKDNGFPVFNANLYPIFFLLQIVLYLLLTIATHKILWNSSNQAAALDESEGIAVRCEDVTKTYRTRRWFWPFSVKEAKVAVSKLNFEVNKGAVVCLLGPNGGGKTTCLKGIVGVHTFDKGSRLSLGCKSTEYGFCPQTNVIWDELTVRQHLVIWNKIKGCAFNKAEAAFSLEEIISECDLGEKIESRAGTLSGGQKRKLQLAISFVGGSKVCCIDEASSGLDPLSRQNIWKIIQRSLTKRTIIMTTHFLDEADILADHIVIISKGQLMCEGPGTLLKARYGDGYNVYNAANPSHILHHASSSAEAYEKAAELEERAIDGVKYEVAFPTLEQVFLKVAANDSLNPNEKDENGDASADQQGHAAPLDLVLDAGQPLNTFQQIRILFIKRFIVLRHNWLAVVIMLAIPIAIMAAVRSGDGTQTQNAANNCLENIKGTAADAEPDSENPAPGFFFYPSLVQTDQQSIDTSGGEDNQVVLGPIATFDSTAETILYKESFHIHAKSNTAALGRKFVTSYDQMVATITNSTDPDASPYVGIFEETNGTSTIAFQSLSPPSTAMSALSYLTNRELLSSGSALKQVSGTAATFRPPNSAQNFFAIPFSIFLVLGFIAGFSAPIIYPTFERNHRSRALQYSNGVSPFALWTAYLLFELQLIIIVAVISYALLKTGLYGSLWYETAYLIGAIILFGIATALGVFLLSLYFSSKAAYPMAATIHAVLVLLYVVAYILSASNAPKGTQWDVQNQIQAGFGLISPGANLVRAFFISMNAYSMLCGTYGDPPGYAFSYTLYGGVYLNFIIQILFLGLLLMAIEYQKFPTLMFRRTKSAKSADDDLELVDHNVQAKSLALTRSETHSESLLRVSNVSKSFNKIMAVDNVSLSIAANETMALLGPNGAGKTTMINVIRGEFRPDSGEVLVKNKSVLTQLVQARSVTGVCLQDDAVEDMTVQHTLMFYAAIKGVSNREKNVESIIAALGIQEFTHRRVSKLSGGTKRKLSVAIALLGNPPLLLLDEPSTGQDASSKRALWKTLRALSHNRAILLTTHSMEEVEALATSVAIVSTSLLASGTTNQLRHQYGGYYHVRVLTNDDAAVRARFGETKGWTSGHGQVKFSLATEHLDFAGIMGVLEGLRREKLAGEYTVNGATLEEVFLNVCGDERV